MFINALLWYLAIGLIGWLAVPLAYRALHMLPDRGLALARPLGLLVCGYLYWLLVSLQVLQNDAGGVAFALLALGLISAAAFFGFRRDARPGAAWRELLSWLNDQRRLIFTTELLFLLAFAAWAVVRAANPDADGTEKPMELAFINAILRSPAFPPSDPWLSGYAISYYYFGYVIVAMLARLSLSTGGVAFNLGLVTSFSLTALAAYGLVYNLLALRGLREVAQSALQDALARARVLALLAPLFVLLVGNLEGPLEVMHSGGMFWETGNGGFPQSEFWSWLNIEELDQPPTPPYEWQPERMAGIWWWRASRVVQDFDLSGGTRENIDEFPAFSYLLGDLHPHVLAMPYALLAISLALNAFLSARAGKLHPERWIGRPAFWLVALVVGGLSFLNTWDFPIYLALFAAAVTLARYLQSGFRWGLAWEFFSLAVALAVVGVVLYIPFYIGFASQASGLLPSLVFFSRGIYFWIMFGSLLLPILAWLVWLWLRRGSQDALLNGTLFAAALIFGFWLLSSLYGTLVLARDPAIAGIWGAQPGQPVVAEAFARRLQSPGAWLSLFLLLALIWGLFQRFRSQEAGDERVNMDGEEVVEQPVLASTDHEPADLSAPFVLLLALLGCGLVLFPEFFYLRDQFGYRMNTIFKFYFQAWIVWGIAAAYGSAVLWQELKTSLAGIAYRTAWAALVLLALIYVSYGVWDRTNRFQPNEWTLDGSHFLAQRSPDDMEAIRWLRQAPYGVVAEAVGGSYSGYARVSTHSGLPGVLGWPGHEGQWRGGYEEVGSREPDLERLYRTRDWLQAREILEQYNIRYVFLGGMERSTYRADEALFERYLTPVYSNPSVTIYEYTGESGLAANP